MIYIKPCNAISIYINFLIFEVKHLFLGCSPQCRMNYCDDNRHCTHGCEEGHWGQTCSYDCPQNCNNQTCSRDDGRCASCKPNWEGEQCGGKLLEFITYLRQYYFLKLFQLLIITFSIFFVCDNIKNQFWSLQLNNFIKSWSTQNGRVL